ncbi:MAG: BlaI/MecI/CopY family transcriptional regulator [Bacteroidales bacterium]
MNKLTKAEEQVMQILWKLEKGLVKDILDEFPKPKPAYNTVSTIIRILEKKGFVDHKAYGNTYEYFPLIPKDAYAGFHLNDFMKNYFNDSFPRMAAFFASENKLSMKEMEEILKLTDDELKKLNKEKH